MRSMEIEEVFLCLVVILLSFIFFITLTKYSHDETMADNALMQACLENKESCRDITTVMKESEK